MPTVRWLVMIFVAIACLSCFSGKKKGGGTNINTEPSTTDHEPYGAGGGGAAFVEQR